MNNDIISVPNNPYKKLLSETIGVSNDIITSASPSKLHNLYRLGVINGCLINSEKAPWHVQKYAEYNFQYLKDNQKDNQSIILEDTKYYDKIRGSSKGQRVLNYKNNLKIDKKAMSGEAQVTGDCVSHAIRAALDQLRCNRIYLGKWEAYIVRQATALIYKSRGYNGQGADSVELSANAIQLGTLLEQIYKTSVKTYDFTNYENYVSWGMNGSASIPADLLELTKPYHAGSYKIAATTDGLADLMFSNGSAHCGSNLGVASNGSPISKRSGSWSHDMNISGFDDTDWCHSNYGGRIWMWDQSWGCVLPNTEVLTNNGWKLITDITLLDTIYTLNQETHEIELCKSLKLHEYDFNGEMDHYECRGIESTVTPNHKMYLGKRDSVEPKDFKLVESQNIKSKFFSFKKNGKWSGAHILKYILQDGTEIDMNLWLEFLGYFLSEGSISIHKKIMVLSNGEETQYNYPLVDISQEKLENLNKIDNLLKQLPFDFKKTQSGWRVYSESLYKELEVFGKCNEKFIPNYVWDCSKDQLNILFESLMLGDGTRSGTKTTYYTSSEQLADDFSRLCLHVGYAGDIHVTDRTETKNSKGYNYNYKEYSIGVITRDNNPCPKDGWKIQKIPYNGKVYCLTVPNHIFYVRQNGQAYWTGNSWNSLTNIPDEWKPISEGQFMLNDKDTQYAVSDGGCVVFFDGDFFHADPISNSII